MANPPLLQGLQLLFSHWFSSVLSSLSDWCPTVAAEGSILCFVMHRDGKGYLFPQELTIHCHDSPDHTVWQTFLFSPVIGVTWSLSAQMLEVL